MLITDWNVPLMDGLELVRWVRREPGCAGVTILLMTTRGNRDDVLEAKEAGVDQYIVKPFTVRELKKKIGSMLKSREPRPA
jgi:DNA-binding response OmpR family regulator